MKLVRKNQSSESEITWQTRGKEAVRRQSEDEKQMNSADKANDEARTSGGDGRGTVDESERGGLEGKTSEQSRVLAFGRGHELRER